MDWKLELVVVPVADVDRAKRFYSEQVVFVADHDTKINDAAVGTGFVKAEPGSLQGVQLVVSDVEAARAELTERGVAVSQVQHYEGADLVDGPGGDWNSFIFFTDPDGNGWAVQQHPPR